MVEHGSAGALLGLRDPTSDLAVAVSAGLPRTALGRLARAMAPADAHFKFRLVPQAALAKQRGAKRLTPEQSALLARVARALSFALEIYGDPESARRFLFGPHMMLGNQAPIDVILDSEDGADRVIQLLGRVAYGGAV
jgi:putative toxin-antitoxin system antitoxin component (TIGR02293 family)